MKSKILFIKLLIIFTVGTAFAQTPQLIQAKNDFENGKFFNDNIYDTYSRVYENGKSNNIDLSTVKGSPYENDSFQLGKAVDELTGKMQSYFLRYNVYNDVIEVQGDKTIIGLNKSINIYAIINNIEYHYELYSDDNKKNKEGYFILLTKGINCNLYLRKTKKFKNKVLAKDSYHKDKPAIFVDSKSCYIKRKRILFPISTKKKKFLKQFPKKENELNEYILLEKINLKSEKDLIKLFKYYDSLL